ncbi:MAG: ATP-binding protein [Prevotella sp.]|nr:ATP-binding protein [Prevotella sp.]
MTTVNKEGIREALREYVSKYPSQNKAAASLDGTSAGTISTILAGKWENISDEMWRTIAAQVGYLGFTGDRWQVVDTQAFKEMTEVMRDAQQWKKVTWVVGEAGCGKTTAAREFARQPSVFLIQCSEDMRKSDFLRTIAQTVGLRSSDFPVRHMLIDTAARIIRTKNPLLIFDEADKLQDKVFHYFIELYNQLEDRCGIVLLSTDYIEHRIRNGLRYNKLGYKEIHSRIGRKFYELDPTSPQDVRAICVANGITERKEIDKVVNDAQDYDFDLRRVKKTIHIQKRTRR